MFDILTSPSFPSLRRFRLSQGGAGKNELQELETLQDRPFNHIYWSPMGNICLLAAMGDDVGPHNGRLEVLGLPYFPLSSFTACLLSILSKAAPLGFARNLMLRTFEKAWQYGHVGIHA